MSAMAATIKELKLGIFGSDDLLCSERQILFAPSHCLLFLSI